MKYFYMIRRQLFAFWKDGIPLWNTAKKSVSKYHQLITVCNYLHIKMCRLILILWNFVKLSNWINNWWTMEKYSQTMEKYNHSQEAWTSRLSDSSIHIHASSVKWRIVINCGHSHNSCQKFWHIEGWNWMSISCK